VVLHYAGWRVVDIAEAFDVVPGTVYGWLGRFRGKGVDGLRDRPKAGRPRLYDRDFPIARAQAVAAAAL
jgi:transposase